MLCPNCMRAGLIELDSTLSLRGASLQKMHVSWINWRKKKEIYYPLRFNVILHMQGPQFLPFTEPTSAFLPCHLSCAEKLRVI